MINSITDEQAKRLAHLQSLDLFEKVPHPQLTHLSDHCIVDEFERGDVLWRAGQEAHYFSFIVSGHVKISKTLLDGRELIMEVFEQGAPLGHVAVFQRIPYPANAEALDDVTLLRIPRAPFLSAMRRDGELLEGILWGMMERNRALTQRLADLATASAEQRLAMLFWAFAESCGRRRKEDNGQISIFVELPLSRQDIASLINTRIETAIRLMSKWNKEGLVLTEEQGFRITDGERLYSLAQGALADL